MASRQAFILDQPAETHFRPATCDEVDCSQQMLGWVTVLDPTQHADLITVILNSGRRFTQMRSEEASEKASKPLPPGLMAFVFPPGQQCFQRHRVQLDKPPLMAHQRGDAFVNARTGSPTWVPNGDRRPHTRVVDFVEHFNQEADAVNRMRQKG
jgi:hypothetical protein